jgi:FkbM family methyltransferase
MISDSLQRSVNFIPWRMRGWIKHLPLIALMQRWFFRRFLANREFLHVINAGPAKGLNYPVRLPEDKAIWAGTYESDFARALADAVSPGDVCYDIGGFRGFFSGVLALRGASLVVTFEPFPENCEQLRRLVQHNPGLPLQVEPLALGDRDGAVQFNVMPEASMGKIADSPFQSDAKETSVINVPLRRIDSLVAEGMLPPKVMKIDVEGAEVKVLSGALEVLRRERPRLFIEAHSHELAQGCAAILEGLGYTVTVMETGLAPDPQRDPEVCHLIA